MTGHDKKKNISRGRGLGGGNERGEETLFYKEGSGKLPMLLMFWKTSGMWSHDQASSGNLSCV